MTQNQRTPSLIAATALTVIAVILSVQAANTLGVFESINEMADGYFWKTKAAREEDERQNKLAKARWEAQRASSDRLLEFNLSDY